ncbi:MAG: helix-turn-helix domain-containing protein [bacterium]
MDIAEAAVQLQMPRNNIRRMCRKGKIKSHKEGRKWVIEGNHIRRIKHGVYEVYDELPEVKNKTRKIKPEIDCEKCVFGKKTGEEKYYCPFGVGCLRNAGN